MKKNTLFLTIIFALFLYSCKSTKQVQTTTDTVITPPSSIAKRQSADDIILQSVQQRSNFDWFAANLSGSVNLGGDRYNISGQIRIKNGEQIWMTISTMGGFIPVANLKITTDSVFLHNRIERTATIRDFSFFREITGVDFTFDMLQDILVGNYFLSEPNGRFSYEFFEGNFLFADYRMNENMMLDFILHNAHYKFVSLTVRNKQNHSIIIAYDNYSIFNDHLFPQNLFIQMKEPMPLELRLNYQKIQINVPQSMPFSIPNSVQRI
jgi:hypothetical protein